MSTVPLVVGDSSAPRRVLIIHGYTGSPDEFRLLAEELATALKAQVRVPLLPGHGTHERNLLKVTFDDLLSAVQREVDELQAEGKPFALVAHSFGGYLALLATENVEAVAIALTVIPYKLRFPLCLPGVAWLMSLRREWGKRLTPEEKKERRGFHFYPHMPGIALRLVAEGNRRVRAAMGRITSAVLTIHAYEDPICASDSGVELLKLAHNPDNKSILLEHERHGLFIAPHSDEVRGLICDFLVKEFEKHGQI